MTIGSHFAVVSILQFSLLIALLTGCTYEANEAGSPKSKTPAPAGQEDEETSQSKPPLECSIEQIEAMLSPHSENAEEVINKIKIGDATQILTFVSEAVNDVGSRQDELVLVEKLSYDYFEDIQDWSDNLPDYSKRVWNSDWQQPIPAVPGYIVRVKVKQNFDNTESDNPNTPIMSKTAEKILLELQRRCSADRPDPQEHEAWISYATITARAFETQGDDEYYLFEMRWHHDEQD